MMYVRFLARSQFRPSTFGSRLAVVCALAAASSLLGCNQKSQPAEGDDATTTDDGTLPDPTGPDPTGPDSTGPEPTSPDPTNSGSVTPPDDGPTPTDSSTDGPTTDDGTATDSSSDDGPTSELDTDTSTDAPTGSSDGTTDEPGAGDEIPAEEMAEYFPLVAGATWTYRHSKTGEPAWSEVTSMAAGTGADTGSFVLSDSPDRQDDITTQWWKQVGSAVMRVKREETRNGNLRVRTTYDPGFTRFDTLWSKVGFEQTITYTHVEVDDVTSTTTMREQHFIVLGIDDSVTIDDTTYDHCIQIARTRPDTMDVGHYWFAKGVGKVKEVDPDSLTTEELVAYDIP